MFINDEDEAYNRTLSKFEKMLKSNKVLFFDSEEFEDIVLHYMDIGKPFLAKKALKLAFDQHPKSTGLKLIQIEILVYEDKFDLAEKLANELLLIEPKNEEAYIQKSNIFSKQGNHQKAIELLEMAQNYTDDHADVYNLIGMEYLFMDNLELAKQNFIKCLEADNEDHTALYNIVYCFEFLDQFEEAISFLNNYIDENPYSEIAWHQIGRLNFIIKNYDQAVRAFEYATYIDEQFIGAYIELGKTFEKQKKYELAIENYQKTLLLEDATSYALLRIGKCYEKLKNKALALKYYNQTVHEDPLLDKGWIAITDFYIKQKSYKKALLYIGEALQIDNKNAKYWKKYATINRKLNLFEEAEFGYRRAVENGDTQLDTWLYWIDIIQFQGEFELAIDTLLLAGDYFPENDEIEYRLAGLYFMMQKEIKAKFHLTNALKINFKNNLIIKEVYPAVWDLKIVQEMISKFKK